jgi:endonuclease/exonuclease/phosphatase (EEP) superfamily protein YafD
MYAEREAMDWIVFLLIVLGLVAGLATILPLWRTTRWWVRIWDFPRFQIALLALLILIVTPLLRPPMGLFDWLFLALLVGVVIWQFTWFGPYLPGAPRAVQSSVRIESDPNRIAVLTTNVLQANRGAQRLLKIIGDADADSYSRWK